MQGSMLDFHLSTIYNKTFDENIIHHSIDDPIKFKKKIHFPIFAVKLGHFIINNFFINVTNMQA